MSVRSKLKSLAERWKDHTPGERANFQSYMNDLCDALEVEKPGIAGSDYSYEHTVANRGETAKTFIDLFRQENFILEAKDTGGAAGSDSTLRKAYDQAY